MNSGTPHLEAGASVFALTFLIYFAYVFLRAFQQQNVIHANWFWIAPISMMMAYGDAFIIDMVATYGRQVWWAMGVGGFTGCWSSMYLHRKYLRKDKNVKNVYRCSGTADSPTSRRADLLRKAGGGT